MRKLVGHYAPYVIGTILLTVLFLPLVMDRVPLWTIVASGATFLVVVIFTWWQMRLHDRSLCEVCARRMPLMPSQSAKRRKFVLLTVHLPVPVFITYIAAVLAADAYMVYNYNTYPVWVAIHMPMLYLMYAHMTHRRLQPWCPICGSGNSYREERLPERVMS